MKLDSLEIAIIVSLVIMGYKTVAKINPALLTIVSSDLTQENCIEEEFNYTSSKECHCYLFQSAGGSHGTFKSPSFPRYYPINVGCILYIFVGAIDELVELTLYEFDMRPLTKENFCHDYLRLYLNLDRPELNEEDRWEFHICGSMQLLPQSVFYSRHRVIIAEFHSTGRFGYNYKYRGFKGNFKFMKKAQFKIDGVHMLKSPCRYRFDSIKLLSGHFFSPNYPQNYPNNTDCIYEFVGGDIERVIIDFANIKLENFRERCDPISAGDRIVVYDGLSKSDRVLGRFCGLVNARQVVSQATTLSVRFQSDDNGIQAQGFAARFQFVNKHTVQPSRILDDTMRGDGQVVQQPSCMHQFRSTANRKSGMFEPPETPYEPGTVCRYLFQGKPGEKVVVVFRGVKLDNADPRWCRSHSGDRIEVFDGMSDAQKWLAVICGKVTEKKVISTGRYLTVKFVADDDQKESEKGFEARYSFIGKQESRNDLSSGLSSSNKEITDSTSSLLPAAPGVCRYQIMSRLNAKAGVLQSPGYPNGFKNDITCYWLFYGEPHERVRIQFVDFSLNKERDLSLGPATEYLPKDSCAGRDRVQIFHYRYEEAIGQVTRYESPIELCGDAEPQYLMSGRRSRMDVIFHSVGGSQSNARGVRFKYAFVTDFGVSAPLAQQKPNACEFHFDGLQTTNGSFNSPNYPGNYPEDLTCDYIFKGHSNQKVSISFADFDVDSMDTSASCRSAPGDYVEAMECKLSGYRITGTGFLTSKRLCRRPNKGEIYRIDWPGSCLQIRFHSNSLKSRRGFFAYYSFYYATNEVKKLTNASSVLSLVKRPFSFAIALLLYWFLHQVICR